MWHHLRRRYNHPRMTVENAGRPAAFVLMSTNHGTMIVNRNDYRMISENAGYGVGFQLMNTSSYDQLEVSSTLALLRARRKDYGDAVVAIDCGANIGVHTIEWARFMSGWGRVYSFEPQEKIYYALAGNIALNNCFNVTARLAAIGAKCGTLAMPEINYCIPSSFGSLELIQADCNEYIGQNIDYDRAVQHIDMLTLDSLNLSRIDLVKIDVEGMELDVLQGAQESILRCRPQLVIEIIKSDEKAVAELLDAAGYRSFSMGMNILAVHASDPLQGRLNSGVPFSVDDCG
jgi:FkbM family methyltransferase